MSLGILTSTLRALKNLREHPTVTYIGINLAGLVKYNQDLSHLGQKKSRLHLIRISAAVCGIELCYAAETAFVSPILLSLGVPVSLMTLVWCLSPLLGFFLVPFLGSLSDRCRSSLGRRRPFILILSAGIILGLILVPNGKRLGSFLGDEQNTNSTFNKLRQYEQNETYVYNWALAHSSYNLYPDLPKDHPDYQSSSGQYSKMSSRNLAGIALTIIGVAMLDFNCDACQSPCRAYLLDISVPEDHSPGLTTFTVMAGLGGCLGYIMGGIDWNAVGVSRRFGGHVQVVFLVVLVAYVICVILTVTSFKEIPLDELGYNEEKRQKNKKKQGNSTYRKFTNEDDSEEERMTVRGDGTEGLDSPSESDKGLDVDAQNAISYGSLDLLNKPATGNSDKALTSGLHASESLQNGVGNGAKTDRESVVGEQPPLEISTDVTLKTYLLSILRMPKSIFILCLTNLFCWMSLVCYSLYFTDFVGQAVFGGDPKAARGTASHDLYHAGVRMGSFGMSLYSLSCAIYSLCIDYLVKKFKAKRVYICSQLVYTIGMILMAVVRNKVAVLLLSPSAGIMYATLFTMPYLLVAHYHTNGKFEEMKPEQSPSRQVRGLGTDVALVSSMVFLAQFLLSVCMGSIVHAAGSTVVVVVIAAILSLCGAITATQVVYLDL